MSVFPQLTSGAAGQFPFRRRLRYRTLVNSALDGVEIRFSDAEFHERLWELEVSDVTDAEWQAIRDLFEQVEGRLEPFTFLAPGENLLSWSEDFGQAVWEVGSGLSVTLDQADPLGGAGAARITSSSTTGAVGQTLNIPASYRYAGSVWARTGDAGAVLRIVGGAESQETQIDSSGQWRRYGARYKGGSAEETVRYEIQIPAGSEVEVFGPQLEAQAGVSAYKKTLKQGGVYADARFDSDELADRVTGVNRHSGVIRVLWIPSPI